MGHEELQPDLWKFLDLDLDGNAASGGDLEYIDLRFYETSKVALRKRGFDDSSIIEQMRKLITDGGESITEVAIKLAPESEGGGIEESKAKRLERKYIRKYSL